MEQKIKILFIANPFSYHIYSFTKALEMYEGCFSINVLDISNSSIATNDIPYLYVWNKVIRPLRTFPRILYHVPRLRILLCKIDLYRQFKRVCDGEYDIINIHKLDPSLHVIRHLLHKKAKTVVAYPFGSEVLRAGYIARKMLKGLLKNIDYVTTVGDSMRKMLEMKLYYPKSKIINLCYGSGMIDFIASHSYVSRSDSKCALSLKDKYVIAVGYNGYKTQKHEEVIRAIARIKSFLPANYILLFQLTYGATEKYKRRLFSLLNRYQLNYIAFEDFLDDYNLLLLRKSCDIFIHAQPTDNASGSVAEYILCDTKVLNGSWVRYPYLECDSIPYFLFHSFDGLSDVLLIALKSPVPAHETAKKNILLLSRMHEIPRWNRLYKEIVSDSRHYAN